jgi:hypothetical protein
MEGHALAQGEITRHEKLLSASMPESSRENAAREDAAHGTRLALFTKLHSVRKNFPARSAGQEIPPWMLFPLPHPQAHRHISRT